LSKSFILLGALFGSFWAIFGQYLRFFVETSGHTALKREKVL
jgi:hypothetical protein